MLWQFHHKLEDGSMEFKEQVDEADLDNQDKVKELMAKHPLVKGAVPVLLNEDAPDFLWQEKEKDKAPSEKEKKTKPKKGKDDDSCVTFTEEEGQDIIFTPEKPC